jgi:hypothetical protein
MTKPITADAFDDLVEDVSVADIATASGTDLKDLVGGWDRVTDVAISPETHTFTAAGTAAAMMVGLTIHLRGAAPILRTATLVADRPEGRLRLARVDLVPDCEEAHPDAAATPRI